MAKTVDRPMYEEFADTPYITQSRDLMDRAYGYTTNALENYNNFINPEQYQAVADAYTQAQWNDLNRNYQRAINQNAAREKQRLGTSGASSSLYNTESLNQQYNDLASRVASQTAAQYNNLINNEYNRRMNTLLNDYNLWNSTGNINYNHDKRNWETRNLNKYNQWANEVAENNKFGDIVNKGLTAVGTVVGAVYGNPQLGYTIGSAVGNQVGGAISDNSDTSGGGWNSSTPYSTFSQNQNWLSNSGVGNYGLGIPTQSSLMDTMNNSSLYKAWMSRGLI